MTQQAPGRAEDGAERGCTGLACYSCRLTEASTAHAGTEMNCGKQ